MATNPELDAGRQSVGPAAGRRGEVSVEMTAQDVLSLAVNFAQNKWPLDESHSTAMRVMLDEIYEQVLEANRLAVEKRLAKLGR